MWNGRFEASSKHNLRETERGGEREREGEGDQGEGAREGGRGIERAHRRVFVSLEQPPRTSLRHIAITQ